MKFNRLSLSVRTISILLIGCGLLVGCGSSNPRAHRYNEMPQYGPTGSGETGNTRIVPRAPWEVWPFFTDLDGVSIRNSSIVAGDTYVKDGRYESALGEYQRATGDKNMPQGDVEALNLRIASTYLSLGKPDQAQAAISSYHNRQGKGVDEVSNYFALVLAYAYGISGDVDQSLAWFSRIDRLAGSDGSVAIAAKGGAKQILASLPTDRFNDVSTRWYTDSFVSTLVAQEARVRAVSGYQAPREFLANQFWRESGASAESQFPPSNMESNAHSFKVGILLPLSGAFSTLGASTKSGTELAFEVEKEQGSISPIFEDYQGDSTIAADRARKLIQTDHVDMLVGPLLSDPAIAVRDIALSTGTPQLSLSKGNNFTTSDTIFRLGATSASQAESLLQACSGILGITRYALVYPETPSGYEFAGVFKRYLNAQGLELLYEASYSKDDSGRFSVIAAELSKKDVQGVFLPDSIPRAQEFFSLLPEKFRENARPLGTALWDDPVQLANSQAVFQGAIYVSPFFGQSKRPIVQNFITSFSAKYGKKPDFLAAQGFDAATMLINAARRYISEGMSFEAAFKDIDNYDGLTGSIRVDASGEVQRTFAVVESRDGELSELVKPETDPVITEPNSGVQNFRL